VQSVKLRRIVPQLALVGLTSVLAAGCLLEAVVPSSGSDCVTTVSKTITIATKPADPPMDLRLQNCRIDVDACTDLCALAMQRANIQGAPTKCSATFDDDLVSLGVSYQVSNNNGSCGFGDDVAPSNAGGGI
jgi:hypothetical protein